MPLRQHRLHDQGNHVRELQRPAPPLRLDGWRDWRVGVLAALISLLAAGWVLRLWDATPGVPWFWDGDSKSFLLMFQNIQTTGWWTTSEVIGGGGTSIAAFPLGGGALVHVVAVRLLGLAVRDPITLYNTYFLLSFPAVALTAYYAFRRLAIRPSIALAISVVYALLPYHFNRGHRGHIFLAAYAVVPLAAMLLVRHAAGEAVLVRGTAAAAVKDDRRAHVVEAVAVALLIGASTMYYALMFAIVLLLVALVVSIHRRSDVVFTSAFRLTIVSGLALAAGLLPTLLTWSTTGLPASVGRSFAASEVYSFKIVSALLPVEDHRLPPFAFLREQISNSPVPGEGPEPLGLVGVFGAGLLLWWVVSRTVRPGSPFGSDPPLAPLALCAALAFLLATTGGFGAVMSAVGLSFLRSWARMGIFIGFFVLTAVGLWLQSRATSSGWSSRRHNLIIGAVLIVGMLDQTTPAMAPNHAALHIEHHGDIEYVRAIEQAVGPSARVLQLPYMTFPENSEPVGIPAYDPLRWPLTGSDLHWSFGAPKDGRADWQRTVSRVGAEAMVIAAVATGHDAIMIDRHGYEGGADGLIEDLEALVGPPVLSPFDRFATFSLDQATRLSQEQATDVADLVHGATVVRASTGFEDTTMTAGQALLAGRDAALLQVDPGRDLRNTLTVTVRPLSGPVQLTITSPVDQQHVTVSEQRSVTIDVPADRGAGFDIEFVAEPATDYGGTRVRWELVDVDLPLNDAIGEAVR